MMDGFTSGTAVITFTTQSVLSTSGLGLGTEWGWLDLGNDAIARRVSAVSASWTQATDQPPDAGAEIHLIGYFQFRIEEAFGPVVAVLASAFIWTLFHALMLTRLGPGTYVAERLGAIPFLANLFVTFLIVGVAVQITHNIWAGVAQNALMGNVALDLYVLSVMPRKVLIADPKSLPIAFLLAIAMIGGLVLGRG